MNQISDQLDGEARKPQLDREKQILDSRAELLAAALAEEPLASESIELLMFGSGNNRLAIETRFVCEVLRDIDITPLPGKHGPLVGVTNHRGEVLAVMSLAPLLQSKSEDSGITGKWIIVVGLDRSQIGIAVTSVSEVAAVPISVILDPSRQTVVSESALVRGVTEDARVILDGQAVLDDPRLIIEDKE